MVKIRKGNLIYGVTMGAYNEIYKKQGYKLLNELELQEKATISGFIGGKSEENISNPELKGQEEYEFESNESADINVELSDDELVENIASLDLDELRRLAVLKGVDTDKYKTKKELRAQIKKVL